MAVLSRNEMEQVIRGGGSVLHGGRIISRVQDLPNDADLAQGNPEQEQQLATALDIQIAALTQQRDRLGQGRQTSEQATTPPSQEPPKEPEQAPKRGK